MSRIEEKLGACRGNSGRTHHRVGGYLPPQNKADVVQTVWTAEPWKPFSAGSRSRYFTAKFESPMRFIEKSEEYTHYYNNDRISLKLKGMSSVQYRTHSQSI